MTLQQLENILSSISGFEGKVVYYAFPENEAPPLPFICYYETESNNFAADGIVYYSARHIAIELYAEKRDLASEALVEKTLDENGFFYNREVERIESEKMYMTTYEIEV